MTHEPSRALDPERLLAHGDFLRALARSLVADPARADDVIGPLRAGAYELGVMGEGIVGSIALERSGTIVVLE
jgi:hypothetical protein